MIALNIALSLKKKNLFLENFNKKILNNKILFDHKHIIHLSLMQFITDISNINMISKSVENINLNILEDLEFKLSVDKINNLYIYLLKTSSKKLIQLQNNIKNNILKYVIKLDQKNNDVFCETINYQYLFDLVNNFCDNIYLPHITIGISETLIDININNISLKPSDFKIDLFKIGDYGTAVPLISSFFYCHRINTSKELNKFSNNYGIELDLRDNKNSLNLVHDPFESGEEFEGFLKTYNKQSIILNVKSERIEYRILDLLKKFNIQDYFFLDCSFPMIYNLNKIKNKNIAIRFSEFESIESVKLIKHMVKWVWVDCFNIFPLDKESYNIIKNAGLKICIVSPELQNHSIERIKEFRDIIINNNFKIDAICTKYYNIKYWL